MPAAEMCLDYRYPLNGKSIDVAILVTPQHLHSARFVTALDAEKHVYQEKDYGIYELSLRIGIPCGMALGSCCCRSLHCNETKKEIV